MKILIKIKVNNPFCRDVRSYVSTEFLGLTKVNKLSYPKININKRSNFKFIKQW